LPENKVVLTGNPVRQNISEGSAETAYGIMGFSDKKPTILIMGGSQGAQKINELISEILPEMTKSYQVIHITGKGKETKYSDENYQQFTYLLSNDLANVYKITDMVISRAGANSITEIIANRKPNILIPLSTSAANHQLFNAREMQSKGCSELLSETKLSPEILLTHINDLLSDHLRRDQMIAAMSKVNPSEATANIVSQLQQYLLS
jgi:UDP-N-acetylglucosamine--N-acetylmuramyl-(pentapeptide) pyrophosphoryl-undecaprenol N-acetylglucosamine transferase